MATKPTRSASDVVAPPPGSSSSKESLPLRSIREDLTCAPQLVKKYLERVHEATKRRDEHLADVLATMKGLDEGVGERLGFIDEVQQHRLLTCEDQAAQLAKGIQGAARFAESSSKTVKQLDSLHRKVKTALEIVESLRKQKESVSLVDAALAHLDYEAAAECILTYDAVEAHLRESLERLRVGGCASPQTAVEVECPATDKQSELRAEREMIETSREKLHMALRQGMAEAASKDDDVAMRKLSKLLSRLSYGVESGELFSKWMRERTMRDLRQFVDRELKKLGSVAHTSHLVLVSQVLDRVVMAIEKEEAHMLACFGGQGFAALLLELHNECTKSSVEVLSDFLTKRKLRGSTNSGAAATTNAEAAEGHEEQPGGGPSTSVDPRQLDETLEDISHLVSCCHLYMAFIDDKYSKAVNRDTTAAGGPAKKDSNSKLPRSSTSNAQYSLVITNKNPLFDAIQELFAIYVPMQVEYFDLTFQQALHAQATSDSEAERGQKGATSPLISPATAAGFMGTISALYSGGASKPPDEEHAAKPVVTSPNGRGGHKERMAPPDFHLVDDLFYVVRVSLHRAMGTKSSTIASATVIAVNELIRDRLFAEISRRVTIGKKEGGAASGGTVGAATPARVLRFINSAERIRAYMCKLTEELATLSQSNFRGNELVRMEEQKYDFVSTTDVIAEAIQKWIGKMASTTAQALVGLKCALPKFVELNYVMGEATFYQCDLCDPWARSAVEAWSEVISKHYKVLLHEELFTAFVTELVGFIVASLEESILKKNYDMYGALQIDKDVRYVKQYFIDLVDAPLRDKFMHLSSILSLLLVDRPSEAADVFASFPTSSTEVPEPTTAKRSEGMQRRESSSVSSPTPAAVITAKEAKAILTLRVEFSKEQIAALKL